MNENNESNSSYRRRRPHSIFGPLLIIGIGVVLLLKPLGVIEGSLWGLFLKAWPVLFIVSGLDSLYRGDSQVGGVVWAGLGVVFLLGNLGYMQFAAWNVILRLWPLLLIIWGLDILFHRRSLISSTLGILIGVGLLAGIVWFGVVSPLEAPPGQIESFQLELEDAEQATVLVNAVTGDLWVGAGAEPSFITEAQIELSNRETLQWNFEIMDGKGDLTIKSVGADSAPYWLSAPDNQAMWKVKLNTTIPMDMRSKLVLGKHLVNLSGLQLENAVLETILGQSIIYLPASGDYEIDASLIIGEMEVFVLKDTAVIIELDTGLTSLKYPDDFEREGDELRSSTADDADELIRLKINLPIGSLNVQYID